MSIANKMQKLKLFQVKGTVTTVQKAHCVALTDDEGMYSSTYIVKHGAVLLTVEDIRSVYQGRWLNDQV